MKRAYLVIIEAEDRVLDIIEPRDIEETLTDPFYGMGHDVNDVKAMVADNIRAVKDKQPESLSKQDAEQFFEQLP